MKKGKLIVFEGLDCGGKTTLIKKLIEINPEYQYGKAVMSDTFFGKFTKKHPSTLTCMIDMALLNLFYTLPALRMGKTILQDRYDLSVITFPGVEKWYNQWVMRILSPFVIKPDWLVYVTVSDEERIRRLRRDMKNQYHRFLVENPRVIKERVRKYDEEYEKFDGNKIRLDSTNSSPEALARSIEDRIK